MFYNCSRKTTPLIALFREPTKGPTRNISVEELPFKTLDDLINRFYAVYNENNYSDLKDDHEEFKYKHALKYFPDEFEFFQTSPEKSAIFAAKCKRVLDSYKLLSKALAEKSQRMIGIGEKLDIEKYEDFTLYQHMFDFEQLMNKQLEVASGLLNGEKYRANPNQMFAENSFLRFKLLVEELLDQMTSAEVWPVLLFTIPYIPWFQGLLNPLTIALHGFM
jgi:hypothetical protein